MIPVDMETIYQNYYRNTANYIIAIGDQYNQWAKKN